MIENQVIAKLAVKIGLEDKKFIRNPGTQEGFDQSIDMFDFDDKFPKFHGFLGS